MRSQPDQAIRWGNKHRERTEIVFDDFEQPSTRSFTGPFWIRVSVGDRDAVADETHSASVPRRLA